MVNSTEYGTILSNSTALNVSTVPSILEEIEMDNSSLWNNYTSMNTGNASNGITSPGLITDDSESKICNQPTEEEYMFYVTFAWWLEGFGQILVGSLGRFIILLHYCSFTLLIEFVSNDRNVNYSIYPLLYIGFIANAVAIPILLSKEMSNVFNRMLSALSVVDNVFIVCSILEAIRKHIGKYYIM